MREKKPINKLTLNKETMRALQDGELRAVAGGTEVIKREPLLARPPYTTQEACGPTMSCTI